jgi:hypothetical protein
LNVRNTEDQKQEKDSNFLRDNNQFEYKIRFKIILEPDLKLEHFIIIILSDLPPVSHIIKGMEGKSEESR